MREVQIIIIKEEEEAEGNPATEEETKTNGKVDVVVVGNFRFGYIL